VTPFVTKPSNARGSSGFFYQYAPNFYPDMFRHMVAILRGSRVPDKLLKQCSVLWACADCDRPVWPVVVPRELGNMRAGVKSKIRQNVNTVIRRITTFRPTTDRIYDGGPVRTE
jgi:hypothetical protein